MKKYYLLVILFIFILQYSNINVFASGCGYRDNKYVFEKGKKYYGQHRYQKALFYFEKVKLSEPQNPDNLKYLASCYEHLGKDNLAISTYSELLDTSRLKNINLSGIPHLSLARLYNKQKQYNKAVALLKEGLKQAREKLKDNLGLFRVEAKFFEELSTSYKGLNMTEKAAKYKKLSKQCLSKYNEEKKKIDALTDKINRQQPTRN